MKNRHFAWVVFCVLVFTNCNTSVRIADESIPLTAVNLNGQPLTIVYASTPLTQDFMISFKNHLLDEFKKKGIKAQLETAKDKLPSTYFLNINILNERSRKLWHLTGNVKAFREVILDIELKNTEGVILRKNQALVDHVYKSELTAATRKTAQKLTEQLRLTN